MVSSYKNEIIITNMERPDIIFCKMLNYQSNMLGSFDSPVIVNEQNLKNALRLGQPNIMQQIKCWIIMAKENRMVVFTTKYGESWGLMNTNRVSLNGERSINWVYVSAKPYSWLKGKNPVLITTYRQADCYQKQ